MSICVTDTTQKVFYNVQYCASEYSIGTNTETTLTIRVTEVESGRTQQEDYTSTSDRFTLATTFFSSFNTYVIECFNSDGEQQSWTHGTAEYGSYKVHFKKMSEEDCSNNDSPVNIG